MKLNTDTITLFMASKAAAERNGFGYVPEIIAFGTLAIMGDSPLHEYLMKQGLEHMEIVTKVTELYSKHFSEEEERFEEYNEIVESSFEKATAPQRKQLYELTDEEYENYEGSFVTLEFVFDLDNGSSSKKQIVITTELYGVLKLAIEIAETLYNATHVTNEYMFAAFTEAMPDIYLEFMENCLGKDAVLPDTAIDDMEISESENDFVIPRNLAGFLTVLNNKYSPSEEYCRILGREKETDMLIKILAKATKRNAILVGYPGVGKTAIVEKLVWNIVKGNCPERFKNSKVLALDVTSIVAGTKYRGMAEARFQELVNFLENNPGCILFIDEIHTVLGAGACREGELDLANSLKPILARGVTQVIGATTFDEYEKYFSKDGALKRRFEKIVVREPKSDELYDMIKNQILNLEEFHHTKIARELVDFAILNASCFNYETKNPDRTLDLLDRAMAGAELKGKKEVNKEDILDNFNIRKKQFERMPEKKKRATAYHEAGHYIVQHFSSELQHYNILAISIIPAEDYLGVNVFEEDEYATPSSNREFYIQMIAKLLGGRRAEKLYTKELSAGANSDLTKATRIAKDMITRYGLDENFTEDRVYLRESENPMYTDRIIEKINVEIDKILGEAKRYADEILSLHQAELEILVEELMKKGMVSKVELERIFSDSESSVKVTTELVTK